MVREMMERAQARLIDDNKANEADLAIIKKALEEGMQPRKDGTLTPVDATLRVEDKALLKLGGFKALAERAFDKETIEEFR